LSAALGVTVREWPRLSGYVDGSRVSVDLKGAGMAEERHECRLAHVFFRLKEHSVLHVQHAVTMFYASVLGNGAAVPVLSYS